jgi:hypothetical protein
MAAPRLDCRPLSLRGDRAATPVLAIAKSTQQNSAPNLTDVAIAMCRWCARHSDGSVHLTCLLNFRDSYDARLWLLDQINNDGSTAGFFTCRTTFGAAFFTGAGLGLAFFFPAGMVEIYSI